MKFPQLVLKEDDCCDSLSMTTKNRDDDTTPEGDDDDDFEAVHDAKYAPVFVDNDDATRGGGKPSSSSDSSRGREFWSGAIDDEQIHGGKSGYKIHPERKTSGRKRGQVRRRRDILFFSSSSLFLLIVVLFRDKGVPRGVLCGHKIRLTNRYSPILYKY